LFVFVFFIAANLRIVNGNEVHLVLKI